MKNLIEAVKESLNKEGFIMAHRDDGYTTNVATVYDDMTEQELIQEATMEINKLIDLSHWTIVNFSFEK